MKEAGGFDKKKTIVEDQSINWQSSLLQILLLKEKDGDIFSDVFILLQDGLQLILLFLFLLPIVQNNVLKRLVPLTPSLTQPVKFLD